MSSPVEVASDPDRQRWGGLLAAQLVAMTALGCFATWSQRYLYADGSNFFVRMLNERHVMDFDPARVFAHFLMEYPTVFLLRELNCRNVTLIGFTYGATVFLAPVAALLLTWWAARKAPAHFWLYPMLSQSIMCLDASFEPLDVHVATWLFWCMLYLLLFPERLSLEVSAILIGLAYLSTRSYESFLFLAFPLAFFAIHRGWRAWSDRRYFELLTCGACLALFLMGMSVTLGAALFTRDEINRGNFAISVPLHLVYPPVWFSLLVLGCVCWILLWPNRLPPARFIRAATMSCGLLVAILPLIGFVMPPLQHIARVQGIYVPLILSGFAIFKRLRGSSMADMPPQRQDELWRLTALTCVVAVSFQCGATLQWNRYLSRLVRELAQKRGVIRYEEFSMASPIYDQLVADGDYRSEWMKEVLRDPGSSLRQLSLSQFNFGFGWTMPSLSVSLSALNLGTVTTIIEAPPSTVWQPFDPRDPAALPDLREYGVSIKVGSRKISE